VRVEHARHGRRDLSLFVLRRLERRVALLEEQVRVVLARKLSDLDQKVPQMLLEGQDVLVQVEEALDGDLDLVVREVGERGAEKVGNKVLKKKAEKRF
jgi:hypothetical protein